MADAAEVSQVCLEDFISAGARRLMKRYWPGALTLLLPAKPGLVEGTHSGGKVAVRMPNHPVALALLRAFGGPLATTSANISGEQGARNPEEVAQSVGEGTDLLLVGGPRLREVASTIIDVVVDPPQQIRAGAIPWEELLTTLHSEV